MLMMILMFGFKGLARGVLTAILGHVLEASSLGVDFGVSFGTTIIGRL